MGEYGSPQQRALQLLRDKHPRPLRRQSLPVSIHPPGEPTLPHVDRHGASIAKPPLTYTHPSLRGKPPPPAGKPPTLELVDRGRRKSTGDLGTRLNTPGTLRPPPPRGPPPPTAKTIAPIAWGAGGTLQSVHDTTRRRSSDFRKPPPGPPPSERRLSAIIPSNPPRALPSNSKSPTIGNLREDERHRNPSISMGNEEALAVRRTSFSAFKGTLSSKSAIDESMKGVSTHRQATSDGETSNRALAKPTARPLPQLPKRRPGTELVSHPGKPPPPRPAGEPPAGQIRRYSISHELCEGVGDFSRRASMITLRGSADTDAGPAPSVPQSEYQTRRLSSDRVLGFPMSKEGGEQSSPPQPSLGGQATILWYNMGVTRQKEMDAKGAVECYQRAVKAGHAKAQHNLAAMYEKGAPGVPKDDVEAVRLFRLAADQGLAESCYSLAMHIKFGLGKKRGVSYPTPMIIWSTVRNVCFCNVLRVQGCAYVIGLTTEPLGKSW